MRVCVHRYVREWNTTARTSLVANHILQHVLKNVHADRLMKVEEMQEVVAHMTPYIQRHYTVRRALCPCCYLPLVDRRFAPSHSAWTESFKTRTCCSTRWRR